MPKKLSTDDALASVLSGLKGEIPVSDLCRKYGVSTELTTSLEISLLPVESRDFRITVKPTKLKT